MTLTDRVLAVVGPGPARIAQVYRALADVTAGRIDCAVHGLIVGGQLRRVGDALHRPAHRLTLRCSACGERRPHVEMVRGDICLRCASDAASPSAKTKTVRTCPACQQEWTIATYGPGVYCPPCNRQKRQEIAAKARAKYRADRRTDPAFARVLAKLRQPNGAKYLSRGGRDETA